MPAAPRSAASDTERPSAALIGLDRVLTERLERMLSDLGFASAPAGPLEVGASRLVVVDLSVPDALDLIAAERARRPDLLIAAHLGVPDRQTWEAAERAGADLVTNRGSLVRSLRDLLERLAPGGARRNRFPLFDTKEVAGRLGLIRRVEETPVGPVAVYRCEDGPACIADLCPHAGARLSEGPYEGQVVTCPAHGSQFDVRTGERLRGPADSTVKTFTVANEDGRIWLLWS